MTGFLLFLPPLSRPVPSAGLRRCLEINSCNCFTLATLVKLERASECSSEHPWTSALPRKKQKYAEGAKQKQNGKWTDPVKFPGREFNSLREYRAAREQHQARRDKYRAQRYHCC